MTKTELHEILKEHNKQEDGGKEIYFSFASENELNYFLSLYNDFSEIKGFTNLPQSELVLDVRDKRLFDWGRISDNYYQLGIIHHLDFSEEKEITEKNIELNVQINEYIGKLSIPFEALQELKKGAKLKLL